jgi:2-polyprenyl-3-methyl-5-hydroxy-6-metoxy-1,4-benzoquinol methylase
MQIFNLFTLLFKRIMATEPLDDITSRRMTYTTERINLLNNISYYNILDVNCGDICHLRVPQ